MTRILHLPRSRTFGNLSNRLREGSAPEGFRWEVGEGATRLCWSDRHACTVIEVSESGKRVVIQADTATRTDDNGMSECQSYDFTPNPDGARYVYTMRKDRSFVAEGQPMRSGEQIVPGRSEYHDYSH